MLLMCKHTIAVVADSPSIKPQGLVKELQWQRGVLISCFMCKTAAKMQDFPCTCFESKMLSRPTECFFLCQ